jgi:hypothetical protein
MKVLRKNSVGYPFPYSEILAKKEDMIVCEMSAKEIEEATNVTAAIKPDHEQAEETAEDVKKN